MKQDFYKKILKLKIKREDTMRKGLCLVVAMALALGSLTACTNKTRTNETSKVTEETKKEEKSSEEKTSGEKTSSGKVYKIGVLQLAQHVALDSANEGFFKALDDAGLNYQADDENAGGDQSAAQTIAQKLVDDKNDLILAIATPAAEAVVNATDEIPVIITAVTDPEKSELVKKNSAPGGNVTGTSDLTPVKEQIDLIKKLVPSAKTVGILYSSAEANSKIQVDIAKEAAKEVGLEVKEFTFSNTNELQTVVESMVGKVDVIYTPTDNAVAIGMETISSVATENKIPIICGEDTLIAKGATATYGIDYYEIGYLAGKQAVRILTENAKPAEMPIEYLDKSKVRLSINPEVAKELGLNTEGLEGK